MTPSRCIARAAIAAAAMTACALCAGAAEPLRLGDGWPASIGALVYRGGVVLDGMDSELGGLSGITVAADGDSVLLISDRGHWFELALAYDAAGWLADASLRRDGPLIGEDGRALRGGGRADSEDLTTRADGTLVAAFERRHRLLAYPPGDPPFARPPTLLARPPGITSAPRNGGLEAITALADGGLLALAEDLVVLRDDAGEWGAAWMGDGNGWSPLAYHLSDEFQPTSAALLPDGDIIVLERRARIPEGLAARLVRVPGEAITAGARLRGTELARLAPPFIGENFEGIAARRNAAGKTLLYLVSDDNFLPVLRSVLMVFALTD